MKTVFFTAMYAAVAATIFGCGGGGGGGGGGLLDSPEVASAGNSSPVFTPEAAAASAAATAAAEAAKVLGAAKAEAARIALTTPRSEALCGNFRFQNDAQAFYDSEPITAASLDADRDGIACETLPKRTTA